MIKRLSIFVYGVLSYAVFFATYLYAIGFVGNLGGPTWVPKSMDSAREVPFTTALLTDLAPLPRRARRGLVPHPARRDGPSRLQALVDPHRPGDGGAQHLCPAFQPRADPAVRVLAAPGRRGLGRLAAARPG